MGGTLSRYLFVVYFVEVGFVLIVVPWTTFWDQNIFVESFPVAETMLTTHVVRGVVSGVGVINIGAALADLFSLLGRPLNL